jgi:hypothetical protein
MFLKKHRINLWIGRNILIERKEEEDFGPVFVDELKSVLVAVLSLVKAAF